MPFRNQVIATGEIYHVFNHSVGSENIFVTKRELTRTLEIINYYRFPQSLRFSKFLDLTDKAQKYYYQQFKNKDPQIDIFSFCLIHNHYHLQIKQLADNGISRFISNFQNSYARYFNIKSNRRGALFCNSFKAKRIETDQEFVHISRYIHLNPVTSFLININKLATYPWTSFNWIINKDNNKFLNLNYLLNMFKSTEDYLKFVYDQADYQKKLGKFKGLILE